MYSPKRETEQKLIPEYRSLAGMPSAVFAKLMAQALTMLEECCPETLPADLRLRYALCERNFALRQIHQPESREMLQIAQRRMAFEQLLLYQAALSILRGMPGNAEPLSIVEETGKRYWQSLPFPPTKAQSRVFEEIRADLGKSTAMRRMVQGDVGCGKTAIAFAAMYCCAQAGRQSALMAPTEILARQHLKSAKKTLEPLGIHCGLLIGGMKTKERREALEAIRTGDWQVVIGTHALLSEGVEYHQLSLVITDEQHRFGVRQRSALIGKGEKPHVLVMSATPIPRTLALMIYGDLDVSIIDELPPGRQKVDTFAVDESYRARLNGFIRKLAEEGRQVFVVCPKVEDDEDEETPGEKKLKSAEEHAKELAREFPELSVGCVHGRMKPRDKDAVMAAFVRGETDILVATTVIEVGVDVPNAALMIIENAERFGLSQLHQLRGRVGRGRHKSWCILVSDNKGEEVKARLSIMSKTNNGFEISEEDLRLRGPGDFFGARQHGLPEMHVADLGADTQVLKTAQEEAKALLAADPQLSLPEHAALRERIETLFRNNTDSFN